MGKAKGGSSQRAFEKQQNASRTTEELTVAPKQQQIDQGLIEVEQRDDKDDVHDEFWWSFLPIGN